MNKEIKMSLSDLYIGYVCAAFLMYAIGGVAYNVGKLRANNEIARKIKEVIEETKQAE
jgi:hypothetical protein